MTRRLKKFCWGASHRAGDPSSNQPMTSKRPESAYPRISGLFSLVELIVGMVLLVFVVFCMVLILRSTQGVFRSSSDLDSVYTDAHAALDIMTRDLQSSLYDGDRIFFWHRNDREINFVAADSYVASTEKCNICEIRYAGPDSVSNDMTLKRFSIASSDPGWDFYTTPTTGAWKDSDFNASNCQVLLDYVTDLKITCYDAANNEIPLSSASLTPYPHYIKIELTVLGREPFAKWKESGLDSYKDENQRTFTATVFTGGRQ